MDSAPRVLLCRPRSDVSFQQFGFGASDLILLRCEEIFVHKNQIEDGP